MDSCECEQASRNDGVNNALECNYQGQLVCGECVCNSGHYGRLCECDGQGAATSDQLCRAWQTAPLCSGRGYCECLDWTCPKAEGQAMCSDHGSCECGECECYDGWTGDACDCSLSVAACISPYNNKVCSGHGDCRCGACVCKLVGSGNAVYTGTYCQTDPTTGNACAEVRECVECQHFRQDDEP